MAKFTQYLIKGFGAQIVEDLVGIGCTTVFHWQSTLLKYSSIIRPPCGVIWLPNKLTEADEKALFETLLEILWMYQDEIVYC
jgi:hypothetical protein